MAEDFKKKKKLVFKKTDGKGESIAEKIARQKKEKEKELDLKKKVEKEAVKNVPPAAPSLEKKSKNISADQPGIEPPVLADSKVVPVAADAAKHVKEREKDRNKFQFREDS